MASPQKQIGVLGAAGIGAGVWIVIALIWIGVTEARKEEARRSSRREAELAASMPALPPPPRRVLLECGTGEYKPSEFAYEWHLTYIPGGCWSDWYLFEGAILSSFAIDGEIQCEAAFADGSKVLYRSNPGGSSWLGRIPERVAVTATRCRNPGRKPVHAVELNWRKGEPARVATFDRWPSLQRILDDKDLPKTPEAPSSETVAEGNGQPANTADERVLTCGDQYLDFPRVISTVYMVRSGEACWTNWLVQPDDFWWGKMNSTDDIRVELRSVQGVSREGTLSPLNGTQGMGGWRAIRFKNKGPRDVMISFELHFGRPELFPSNQ